MSTNTHIKKQTDLTGVTITKVPGKPMEKSQTLGYTRDDNQVVNRRRIEARVDIKQRAIKRIAREFE